MARNLLLLLALVALCPLLRAEPAEPLPTLSETRSLFDEGKYPQALQNLARLLALKGEAARGVDRYQLLLLKAETHMQMRALLPATAAFAEAAKLADGPRSGAESHAMELLLRRSKGFVYTPRVADENGKPKDPIPFVDKAQRKAALEALLNDDLAAAEPRLAAARKARALAPIMDAAKAVGALRPVELAARGTDEQTAKLIDTLTDRARYVMGGVLKNMSRRVTDIQQSADELVEYPVEVPDDDNPKKTHTETRPRRRGLGGNEAQELKRTVATCAKVHQVVKEFCDAAGADRESFNSVVDDAQELGLRAADVINTNYGPGNHGS